MPHTSVRKSHETWEHRLQGQWHDDHRASFVRPLLCAGHCTGLCVKGDGFLPEAWPLEPDSASFESGSVTELSLNLVHSSSCS